MYAKGMTTADIESHMRDLHDIEISDSTISRITDKILPIVKEWQERPLEEVYAVAFMDAIHYHVRSEGRIVKRAVYIAIGIDMSGRKDVLGMYVVENESAKFWLSIMNSLKNRGVEEIPTKYASYKDLKKLTVRRLIYTTNTIEGVNRQLRKVTKSKNVFPSDDRLLKMLYLAMIDITKKWTGHRQD